MQRTAIFKALADDTRRAILELLAGSRRPVGDLAARFPEMSRPAVSKHLRILRQAGLVTESRQGRQRLYRLEPEKLGEIERWLDEIDTRAGGLVVGPSERGGAKTTQGRAPRRRAGLRPLRRDEPVEGDWRSW